ncbi:MAG TPA: hypothetical protein VIK72_19275 [Clostridiaceae bacterium]
MIKNKKTVIKNDNGEGHSIINIGSEFVKLNQFIILEDGKGYEKYMNFDDEKPWEKEFGMFEFEIMCKNKRGIFKENPMEMYELKFKKLIEVTKKYGADITNIFKILI